MRKLAYIYHKNPFDINVQSGRPYSILNLLKNNFDVRVLNYNNIFYKFFEILDYTIQSLFLKKGLRGRGYLARKYIAIHIYFFQKFNGFKEGDLIFSPSTVAFGGFKFNNLKNICCVDSLILGIASLYPNYKKNNLYYDIYYEKVALSKIDLLVVPSEWAALQATELGYTNKILVLPFGFNLRNVITSEISFLNRSLPSYDDLKLVTVMADWNRKGGDLVINLLDKLSILGIKVTLNIIGECKNIPSSLLNDERLCFYGRLNKTINSESQIFNNLFLNSHFYLMPSKGEAYGMSVSEAYYFGLPVFVSNNGGISCFGQNDMKSTFILNDNKNLSSCVNQIDRFCNDSKLYLSACENSKKLSNEIYSWDVFEKKLLENL